MSDVLDRLDRALTGRYRVKSELGAGGMATVYLAHDLKHDRQVAIKVLRPELSATLGTERFLREIKTTARLSHPHILPLFDSGEADSLLYFVMPYVEGESLRDKLDRERQLGLEETMAIARAVASALDFAHERGIVHRDVKPGNILLQGGHALVADFGIALALRAAEADSRLTETSLSPGTPQYMSPEQAAGETELDARSDIYSLGVVVYEMLTGEPPHAGATMQAVVARVLTQDPLPVSRIRPGVSPQVERAVQRALAKAPVDRFRTATEFAKALTGEVADTEDRAMVLPRALSVGVRRHLVVWGGGIAVAALAAVGLIVASGSELLNRGPPSPVVPRWTQVTYTGDAGPAALSPDGASLAFVTGARGAQRLLLQEVDGGPATEVGSYEYVTSLDWSSDGARLLFQADGSVFLLPRFGGVPRPVTAGAIPRWSPDNAWIASVRRGWPRDGEPGLLMLTNVSSGERRSVEIPHDISQQEWRVADLEWSPDGTQLAFLVRENPRSGGPHALWTIGIDGSGLKPGPRGRGLACLEWSAAAGAIYAAVETGPTAELLKSAVADGSPGSFERILSGLQGFSDACFTVSADARHLLYTRTLRFNNLRVQTAEAEDPDRATQITRGTQKLDDPVVSPDGRLVAYDGYHTREGANIFTIPVDGRGSATQVTFEGGSHPVWSPDGTELAFDASRGGERRIGIVKLATGAERRVGRTLAPGAVPAWAPGQEILYRPEGETTYFAVDPVSGEEEPIHGTTGLERALPSPDGTRLAAIPVVSHNEVVLVSRDTGARSTLYSPAGRTYIYPMRWSEDGQALYVYEVRDPSAVLVRVPMSGGSSRGEVVFRLPFSLGSGFPIIVGVGPDGRSVVYSVLELQSDLWLVENFDPEIASR